MATIAKNINLGLPADLLKQIDKEARKQKLDRTNFIRRALEHELLRIAFEDEAREQMLANRDAED